MPSNFFHPVLSCCGAGSDPGAEFIKANPTARKDCKLAFAFTDVPVEDSIKIAENFYVQMPDNRDWEPKQPYSNLEEVPYLKSQRQIDIRYIENMYPQQGLIKLSNAKVRILHYFLTGNFPGYKERMIDKLSDYPDDGWIAICAGKQHEGTEALLIDLGFRIVKRKTSPKTESRLTLYYKEPSKH